MKSMIDVMSGRVYLVDEIERGDSPDPTPEVLDALAEQITTLQNNDSELGDQVQGIQGDVNTLKTTAVTTVGNHEMAGELVVKDRFEVSNDEGGVFEVSFLGSTVQVATNNGLDVLAPTNFLVSPTTESASPIDSVALNELINKQQALQAVQAAQKSKFICTGVPATMEFNEAPYPVEIPLDIPFVESSDIALDVDNVVLNKAGVIHISRDVRLNAPLSEPVHYEVRVNDEVVEALRNQSVIVACSYGLKVDFYVTVNEGDKVSIWASTAGNTISPDYRGVTTVVEYV